MKVIKIVVLLAAVTIISLLLAGQARAQSMTSIVDIVIEKAKSSALNSRTVNWDSVQTEMHLTAKNAKSVHELRQSFETLLVSLNDKHGVFYDPSTSSRIAENPHHRSEISNQELQGIKGKEFHYQNIQNGVHYIRIVAAPAGADILKQAELIRKAVDSLSKEEEPYWIVDLRYAAGGEMHSLFAGVGPLLGEGLVVSSIDGKKQIRNLYTVHNGNFYDNQVRVGKFPVSDKHTKNIKVAVLTSKYTTGASEILALAFKGGKNTRLFGEETAGKITGTTDVSITGSVVMSITEMMYTDRRGTSYADNVAPDSIIEFTPNTAVEHDKAVSEAILWLTTTPVSETGTKVTMK